MLKQIRHPDPNKLVKILNCAFIAECTWQPVECLRHSLATTTDPGVHRYCPFQVLHIERTNRVYPSGSSPFDSTSCQNTDSSGAEPSITGDLLYQCLSSTSSEGFFFFKSVLHFSHNPQHLWIFFPPAQYIIHLLQRSS